jgi:cytochrome c-type biogenesis protein CcmH/NrfF
MKTRTILVMFIATCLLMYFDTERQLMWPVVYMMVTAVYATTVSDHKIYIRQKDYQAFTHIDGGIVCPHCKACSLEESKFCSGCGSRFVVLK